jgi:hypothetical protein
MKFPLVLLTLLLTTGAGRTQQDLPKIDADQMLRFIEQFEQKQKEAVRNAKASTLNTLQPGTTGGEAASRIYEEAIKATQFGSRDSAAKEFADWKKKQAELLRSREMRDALQLHIRYLILSIQRSDAGEDADISAPSWAYAQDLAATLTRWNKTENVPREARDILNKSINDSIFTKWLSLSPWLPKSDWELDSGNLDGILDKNIRPTWRKSGNPQLLTTWDFQMKFHADQITTDGSNHQAAEFNTTRRPQMLFSRAEDLASMGQPNRAATEVFAIVKDNPTHPDFGKWVGQLRDLLEKSLPGTAPAPTSAIAPH